MGGIVLGLDAPSIGDFDFTLALSSQTGTLSFQQGGHANLTLAEISGHASWSQGSDTAIEISAGSTVSGLTPGAPHVRLDGNTFLPGWRENTTVAGGSGRFPTVTGSDAP